MKANLATSHAICCDAWRNSGSFQTSNATAMCFKQGLIETRLQYYSWLSKKKLLGPTRILKGYSRLVSNLGKIYDFPFLQAFLCVFFVCFPEKMSFLKLFWTCTLVIRSHFEGRTVEKFQCQWPVTSVFTCTNASSKTEGIRHQRTCEKKEKNRSLKTWFFVFFLKWDSRFHYSHLQTLVIRLPHPCPAVRHL